MENNQCYQMNKNMQKKLNNKDIIGTKFTFKELNEDLLTRMKMKRQEASSKAKKFAAMDHFINTLDEETKNCIYNSLLERPNSLQS